MLQRKHDFSTLLSVLHIIFVIVWLRNLAHTDAYFSIYIIIAFFSFYLQTVRSSEIRMDGKRLLPVVLSLIFSAIVVLANYPIFSELRDPERIGRSTNLMVNLINTLLSLIGGFAVSFPILRWWFRKNQLIFNTGSWFGKCRVRPIVTFLFFAGLNLIHLFFVEYPGNLTQDTFTQISEMVSGQYSNFNTFWHTVLFRGILTAGYAIFGNMNAAVSLFCVFQIFVMSFAFSYCLDTMEKCGAPRGILFVSFLVFAVIPYQMALIITIWKDVLFAGGCLLMVTALYRIMKCFSKHIFWDYVVFLAGSLLFLLSRTNGWIIYSVMFLVYLFFNHRNRRLLAVMGSMAVLGWFLLNPMLSILNVTGGDLVESLSLPVQQVSRVIADGCEISDEDAALLSKVIDLDEVPELYTSWLSDPMKVEFRSKDYEYFQKNLDQYRELWIRLGLEYPLEYLKAWVDQTKGYWNAGYDYAMYSETVTDNPYGVEKTVGGNPIASLFRLYFGLSRHVVFFEPLHSIGLHVWIMILCFLRNLVRKREEWILSVPVLLLVVGLWFGTPVYACFRYVYPLFVCFPLIVSTTLFSAES